MYALISPNEKVVESNTGTIIGERVAQVSSHQFDVALPLFWLECDNGVTADQWYYDSEDQMIKLIPEPIISEAEQPTVQGAQTL